MKRRSPSITRRVLIGGAITGAVLPRLVWAQKETNMKMRIAFADHVFTATLYDSPPARDLWSMLPLDLEIDNYANNEKIAYLPRKLTEEGSGSFSNEAPGDLCYYAPWGNLAFFYAGYRYSAGLIRLGRLMAASNLCSHAESFHSASNDCPEDHARTCSTVPPAEGRHASVRHIRSLSPVGSKGGRSRMTASWARPRIATLTLLPGFAISALM